jgi:Raf kinase inhibitor-like YbhB/YbcL family protein
MATNNEIGTLLVSSTAFRNGETIPSKYTCEGEEVSPPLRIENIPEFTQTLAIIVEDPDTSRGIFDHWLVWNIPVTRVIEENSIPGISGINGAGKTGYHPPCPPSGSHRYYFYVFALNSSLDLHTGDNKEAMQKAMEGHILAKCELMGRYQKVMQGAG